MAYWLLGHKGKRGPRDRRGCPLRRGPTSASPTAGKDRRNKGYRRAEQGACAVVPKGRLAGLGLLPIFVHMLATTIVLGVVGVYVLGAWIVWEMYVAPNEPPANDDDSKE